jgi:photosystem II stability/assembly factor-like uncharacterized protein
VLLAVSAAAMAAASPARSPAASSSVVVALDVATATVLDTTACATGTAPTTLQALPGSPVVTSTDCSVGFGATNGPSVLDLYQEDGTGTALAGPGDRSDTWTALPTGTTKHLRSLTALPDGRIWTSGYDATLLYSSDGGDSWVPQSNPADNVLRDLYAVDGNVIWGTGWTGNVIRTVDGGATWTQVGKGPVIGTSDVRGGVRALDANTAWVGSAASTVYRTTNGGGSWTALATGAPSGMAWGMALVGASTLWVVGDAGSIVKTSDGGDTWTVQRTGPGSLYRVSALDAQHVIASGTGGTVLATSDGGSTWVDRSPPTATNTLDGVAMLTQSHWLVVGYDGRIFETRSAGASWDELPSGTTTNLRALWAPDSVSIWAVGNSGTALRAPVTAVADYDDAAGDDFATPDASFFGACLRATSSGASTDAGTWSSSGTCPASDGAQWRAIVPTSGSAGVTVARTLAPVPIGAPAVASLRFGARPPVDAAPGTYRARLVLSVQAP